MRLSCTIPLSPPPAPSLFRLILNRQNLTFVLLLLPLRDKPLDNRLPHDIIDALRLVQLLPETCNLAFELCYPRLKRHTIRFRTCSGRLHEVRVVFDEIFP